jgi:hypothetical protein
MQVRMKQNMPDKPLLPMSGTDVLHWYLGGMRACAQALLGIDVYTSIHKLRDFRSYCTSENPIFRSWAFAELLAEVQFDGQPLDNFLELLNTLQDIPLQRTMLSLLARFYPGSGNAGLCRLLAQSVLDESADRTARAIAYYFLCRVAGIGPSDPFVLINLEPSELFSQIDWDAVWAFME